MTTDIARLRELASRLQSRREMMSYGNGYVRDLPDEDCEAAAEAVLALLTELATTRAQVAGMRTALEFYADPHSHRGDDGGILPFPAFYVELDFGKRAREALSPTPAEKA